MRQRKGATEKHDRREKAGEKKRKGSGAAPSRVQGGRTEITAQRSRRLEGKHKTQARVVVVNWTGSLCLGNTTESCVLQLRSCLSRFFGAKAMSQASDAMARRQRCQEAIRR